MLYTLPDDYKQFSCIAGNCEDTCCAGWQIVIDERSLARYKNVKSDFCKRLHKSIHWRQKIFKQDKEKRCAFLNSQNLCDMYTALGKEALCQTCKKYPRHIEVFENVREISLSVSCPTAARMILSRKAPLKWIEVERDKEEVDEDFDVFLYSKLVDARGHMFDILQNRSLPVDVRCRLVLSLAWHMQKRIDAGELFSCDEIFDYYHDSKVISKVTDKLHAFYTSEHLMSEAEHVYSHLFELERLREDWELWLHEAFALVFSGDEKDYRSKHQSFKEWLEANLPEAAIWFEHLMVYYIYTYFCGAVYDGMIYPKARMAVYSVFLIYEMLLAKWFKNDRILDVEDAIEIVYRYARELEHSDLNLNAIEHWG